MLLQLVCFARWFVFGCLYYYDSRLCPHAGVLAGHWPLHAFARKHVDSQQVADFASSTPHATVVVCVTAAPNDGTLTMNPRICCAMYVKFIVDVYFLSIDIGGVKMKRATQQRRQH